MSRISAGHVLIVFGAGLLIIFVAGRLLTKPAPISVTVRYNTTSLTEQEWVAFAEPLPTLIEIPTTP